MQHLDRTLERCRREITFSFIRGSGPGGQNVNKVATAVQLHFDIRHSPSLTDAMKHRLTSIAGRRLTSTGGLIIEARRYRTQAQNRDDALARFAELLRKSAEIPKPRRKTKPSRASRERRLETKKKRAALKRTRRLGESD